MKGAEPCRGPSCEPPAPCSRRRDSPGGGGRRARSASPVGSGPSGPVPASGHPSHCVCSHGVEELVARAAAAHHHLTDAEKEQTEGSCRGKGRGRLCSEQRAQRVALS
uniref:Uncharacterized protein n=1 Tax=Mustela putorius furo TaxID=9669 RepID=M3YPK9_MUSPF